MFKQLLNNTVYVKVTSNQIWARHIENQSEVLELPAGSFTTKRLLVGEYSIAESCIRTAIKKVSTGKWLPASPVVIIHPMEMIDGGLSEIEERVFKELAAGVGARKVVVWTGHELSDKEVLNYAKGDQQSVQFHN